MEVATLVFMGSGLSLFNNNFTFFIVFLVVQSLAAFMLLVFYRIGFYSLFTFSFLFKLAIFPFYFWFVSLGVGFGNVFLFISITFYKIPPLFLFYSFMDLFCFNMLWLSIPLRILRGGVIMLYRSDMRLILIGSSLANNTWFVLSEISRFSVFLVFFVIYTIFIFILLNYFGSKLLAVGFYNKSNNIIFLSLIRVSGLPPFPIFFIKVIIVLFVFGIYPWRSIIMLVLLFNLLVLLGYMKYMFSIGIGVNIIGWFWSK
jgi:hypothetical protein